jgi:hypothetical protein
LFPCLQAKGQILLKKTHKPKEIKIPDLLFQTYPVRINAHSGLTEKRSVYYIIDGVPVKDIGESVIAYMEIYPMSPLPIKEVYTRQDLDKLPYIDIKDIVASSARVFQQQRGNDVNIRNGGQAGTLYVIDGMIIMN